ncbi:MAG: hypothetical protein ACE5H4_16230 [Candidatus Thorarchaeota archaeon]
MIDDDEFQKIFRKMMEQFFGTFGMPNGGNRGGGFWDKSTEGSEGREIDLTKQGPHVERFDLDDKVILVIDGCSINLEPTVKVSGNRATVTFGSSAIGLEYETPFKIDADKSAVSCRNGVAEVKLEKAEEGDSFDDVDRILRSE